MPLKLYYSIESPPCRAVLITGAALELKMDLRHIDLAKRENLTTEYLKINPVHSIPTLDDDGVIIPDSHAIITYLVSKYGNDDSLYPRDLAKRSLVDARLHFDSSVAFPILKITYRAHIYEGQTEYLTQWQTRQISEVYDFVNAFLAKSKWVAGESVTLADISLATTISSLDAMLPIDDVKYPKVRQWLEAADALDYFCVNKQGKEEYRNGWIAISKH